MLNVLILSQSFVIPALTRVMAAERGRLAAGGPHDPAEKRVSSSTRACAAAAAARPVFYCHPAGAQAGRREAAARESNRGGHREGQEGKCGRYGGEIVTR